jgi:hypothetical protein
MSWSGLTSRVPLAFTASNALFAASLRAWSCASKAVKIERRPIRKKWMKNRFYLRKETDLLT